MSDPVHGATRRVFPVLAVLLALFAGSVAVSAVLHSAIWKTAVQAAAPTPRALFGKDSIRILVVGLDYDYDSLDQETSAHSRSDIIMAVAVNFEKRTIGELSVPRDMIAIMPDGSQAKINEAQSEGGISESEAVVTRWLGIPPFDRYVILRIDTMKDLIDAIGGVDVYVRTSGCLRYHTGCTGGRLDYDDSWGHLHVHLTEGLQHLNGAQAVGYARFRHDWCSDPCRIMRQQEVAKAIVRHLSADRLGVLAHLDALAGVLSKDVSTNLSVPEQASIASSLRNLRAWKISTGQVPYLRDVDLPGYGDSLVPDDASKRHLVNSLLLQ